MNYKILLNSYNMPLQMAISYAIILYLKPWRDLGVFCFYFLRNQIITLKKIFTQFIALTSTGYNLEYHVLF